MELGEYQREAQKTDQFKKQDRVVPLLGMGGEVGSLLAEYKKWMRDGEAHVLFPEQVAEELGDILWYLANTATKFDLDLDAIAAQNLAKTRDRWPPDGPGPSTASSTPTTRRASNCRAGSRPRFARRTERVARRVSS